MPFLTALIISTPVANAFEHEGSAVQFQEYNRDVIKKNRQQNKPYFLLFAAQWCHWCAVFAEETLTKKKVYTYLNKHFTNIFIDIDIHSAAYLKYKATGLPYTVFLNPDGSHYYKYAHSMRTISLRLFGISARLWRRGDPFMRRNLPRGNTPPQSN
jgi:uncharacterized protein YyaL (SSP411 family)